MAAAENLYDITRNFLTPDSIKRFSLALNEPMDRIEAGLKAIVPTLLKSLINEGSTSAGAQKIVNLVERENFATVIPQNLNDAYISKGEHAVENLFGDRYQSIATKLTPQTGLKSGNFEKLMSIVTPVLLGLIGHKIKAEGMNANSLSGFFLEQRFLTEGSFEKKKIPFAVAVGVGLIATIGLFWLFSSSNPPVARMTRDLASLDRSVSSSEAKRSKNGLTLQDLPEFMRSGTQNELPKRFSLNNVSFAPGTTDFNLGGDQDLNLVASALKRFPKATASIEAFAEETGDPDENLLVSENRAMLIREELIGRGIEPSRIKAVGRGPKAHVHQIYFVITHL